MPVKTGPVDPWSLLGVPFRLHGRDPAIGLDCVGLVALVHDRVADAPTGYALRTSRQAEWMVLLDGLFIRNAGADISVGDVVMLCTGPATVHLGIWTGTSLIHADARLKRVVETPPPLPWPVLATWHNPERFE
jgi:murein DD-endopeptidase / murein LD-carboxypeptidase